MTGSWTLEEVELASSPSKHGRLVLREARWRRPDGSEGEHSWDVHEEVGGYWCWMKHYRSPTPAWEAFRHLARRGPFVRPADLFTGPPAVDLTAAPPVPA